MNEAAAQNESVASCRGLTKVFHDGQRELHILRGVDLSVAPGRVLAISGTSGAGKSTLLHILGTLDHPTQGEVWFGDRALHAMKRAQVNRLRNKEIGFVFQFYHLLPEFTARENVMMPALACGARPKACRDRAEELLEKVGLGERMNHKPGMLSGGEQQRVAIARALFNQPRILLADEPTGNLDEHTGADIFELLWRLNEDEAVAMVLVTHDETLAARAHDWLHLHEGKLHPRNG
jgi:lipoprotein-releasing system ATP-binding protein